MRVDDDRLESHRIQALQKRLDELRRLVQVEPQLVLTEVEDPCFALQRDAAADAQAKAAVEADAMLRFAGRRNQAQARLEAAYQ